MRVVHMASHLAGRPAAADQSRAEVAATRPAPGTAAAVPGSSPGRHRGAGACAVAWAGGLGRWPRRLPGTVHLMCLE